MISYGDLKKKNREDWYFILIFFHDPFEDKTAKKGTTYYYAVRAGIKTSGGKVLCGGYAAKAAKR